jgi:hypothetical protein
MSEIDGWRAVSGCTIAVPLPGGGCEWVYLDHDPDASAGYEWAAMSNDKDAAGIGASAGEAVADLLGQISQKRDGATK